MALYRQRSIACTIHGMQRRTLLKLGIVSAAVLVVAGGVATLLQPGWQQDQLTPVAREVFSTVARAILEGTLPQDASGQKEALDGLLNRIDHSVAAFPPHVQAELSQLMGILSSSLGRRALTGLVPAWNVATVPEVQEALQAMRLSSVALRQQTYHALHDLIGVAYFSDASTWPALGYPGPLTI